MAIELLQKMQQLNLSIVATLMGANERVRQRGCASLVRPTATLCLEAQQRRELKQKMYSD